ncbi:hypothetical protein FQN54_003487 [Arachnomyces sp. PD_36]|nr:hypothetical protein FQN54_003487 [Arachnomyces sp. PD_36]
MSNRVSPFRADVLEGSTPEYNVAPNNSTGADPIGTPRVIGTPGVASTGACNEPPQHNPYFLQPPSSASGSAIPEEYSPPWEGDFHAEITFLIDPSKPCPANIDPNAGIELVCQYTASEMGKKAPAIRHWYPGDPLPDFESLAWNDLERLSELFHYKLNRTQMLEDMPPAQLKGFQRALFTFLTYKKELLRNQSERVQAWLDRLVKLGPAWQKAMIEGSKLQQEVEDRLTAGCKRSEALKPLKKARGPHEGNWRRG